MNLKKGQTIDEMLQEVFGEDYSPSDHPKGYPCSIKGLGVDAFRTIKNDVLSRLQKMGGLSDIPEFEISENFEDIKNMRENDIRIAILENVAVTALQILEQVDE